MLLKSVWPSIIRTHSSIPPNYMKVAWIVLVISSLLAKLQMQSFHFQSIEWIGFSFPQRLFQICYIHAFLFGDCGWNSNGRTVTLVQFFKEWCRKKEFPCMPPCKDGNFQNIVTHFFPFLCSPSLFRGETLPAAYFLASSRLSLFKISRHNFTFILWAMKKYLKTSWDGSLLGVIFL